MLIAFWYEVVKMKADVRQLNDYLKTISDN
jgi:hypothetical protein